MAEKKGDGGNTKFDPDERFKYIGFEVHQGKIGDLFKSESEQKIWVDKVLDKRKKFGAQMRGFNSFSLPRLAGYEKIAMTITSLVLVISLFLPWFSGYTEQQIEAAPAQVDNVATSVSGLAGDSTGAIPGTTDESAGTPTGGADLSEKDERGFSSISSLQKRKEIKREHQAYSAIGILGRLGSVGGAVFSSGFVLMLTGFLMIIYILACLGSAGYTLYLLYGIKADPDTHALKIKQALRFNWIPVGIWGFGLIISFFGASYSFETAGLIKQIGTSYGPGAYLGILGYGFYVSLAGFIMNAVKAVEI